MIKEFDIQEEKYRNISKSRITKLLSHSESVVTHSFVTFLEWGEVAVLFMV